MKSKYFVDAVGLEERVNKFKTRSIKKESKKWALEQIIRMIDLTTLEGADTDKRVARLVQKGVRPNPADPKVPSVAAICVYPRLVPAAKKELEKIGNHNIMIAAVATSFPAGQSDLSVRLKDVEEAINNGANEIDMVISRNSLLSGDYSYLTEEVKQVKHTINNRAHLKVILEVGELGEYEKIKHASFLAINGGADFIKTSTGKIPSAASLMNTLVMLEVARDHYNETGKIVGVKAAGGIRTAKEAIQYMVMINETMTNPVLNKAFLSPEYFRFGASSLLNDVVRQLNKQKTGNYEGNDYLTIG